MDIACNLKTYITLLPYTLIVEILKYITIEDCINFCDAFKHFKNVKIISKIDLARCYKLDIDKVLSTINCNRVTSVNLNHCHWLSKNTLHNFILQLPNIQILSALDTKLDLTRDTIEILNKTKIHRLAVTLANQESGKKCSLQKITELHLEVNEATLDYFEENFNDIVRLPNVERAWVRFLPETKLQNSFWPPYPNAKWLRNCAEDKLKNVTFWLYRHKPLMPRNWKSFRKYYETGPYRPTMIVCYEKTNNSVPQHPWNVIDGNIFETPFGPKDTMKLNSGEESLATIKSKELFFLMGEHSHIYSDILKAQAGSVERLEIHAKDTYALSILEDVCQNMINLKQLALYSLCDLDAINFHLISNLTMLKFLHVDIPEENATTFLPAVFQKCTSLEHLSLNIGVKDWEVQSFQDKFLAHFSDSLVYANNLKELFFQCHDDWFDIDEIISILNRRKRIKLVNLKMMVNISGKLKARIWKEYFEHNEQLMECVIGIRYPDRRSENMATELCRLYERPRRKLRIGRQCYGEYDLEVEMCENTPCSMKIDDDFFILNK